MTQHLNVLLANSKVISKVSSNLVKALNLDQEVMDEVLQDYYDDLKSRDNLDQFPFLFLNYAKNKLYRECERILVNKKRHMIRIIPRHFEKITKEIKEMDKSVNIYLNFIIDQEKGNSYYILELVGGGKKFVSTEDMSKSLNQHYIYQNLVADKFNRNFHGIIALIGRNYNGDYAVETLRLFKSGRLKIKGITKEKQEIIFNSYYSYSMFMLYYLKHPHSTGINLDFTQVKTLKSASPTE